MTQSQGQAPETTNYTINKDYTTPGKYVGRIVGGITTIATAFSVPLYPGWKAGEYVSQIQSIPKDYELITKLAITAATSLIGGIILSILLLPAGITFGEIAGESYGRLIQKRKDLEQKCKD